MTITLDDFWLAFLVATLLPMVTAFVTNRWAASQWKALTLLALSVISGALTSIQAAGGSFDLKAALTAIVVTFITAVGVHYGLLKPIQVTGRQGVIARAVPAGIGKPVPPGQIFPEGNTPTTE